MGGKIFSFDQENWSTALGNELITHLSIGLSITTSISGIFHREKMVMKNNQIKNNVWK